MEDPYAAYCLDQAVGYWGREVEGAMDEAGENAKDVESAKRARRAVLEQYMPDLKHDQPVKGQFADPAAMFG